MSFLGSVEVLWIVLSLLVSACGLFALVQTNWLVNAATTEAVGILTKCELSPGVNSESQVRMCGFYDEQWLYAHLPTRSWQLCALVYGLGVVLMLSSALGAAFSLLVFCRRIRILVAKAASGSQAVAGQYFNLTPCPLHLY